VLLYSPSRLITVFTLVRGGGFYLCLRFLTGPTTSGSCAEGSVPEATAFSQSYLGLVPSVIGYSIFTSYLFELDSSDLLSLSCAEV
jgi:hypothetical protein